MSPGLAQSLRLDLLGRLLLAAILGGLIGLEREFRSKPAGLRTNLLICVGAALLMEVSMSVASLAEGAPRADGTPVGGDPGRIAAQIVSGIGFLGAGTILQSKGSVIGLTTAATIWVVAAIGMAVGASEYVEAIGASVLVGLSLVVLARVEDRLIRQPHSLRYSLTLQPSADLLGMVESTFTSRGLKLESQTVEKTPEGFETTLDVVGPSRMHGAVLKELATHPGVVRLTRLQ